MARLSIALASALLAAAPALAQGQDCAELADLRLTDVNLLSAAVVPATETLPEYCSVVGYVRPAINFEIRLPTEGWNGGFYMAGCGGFCGQVEIDRPGFINAATPGLVRGYAVATMDSGHWGSGSADARWAFHDRVAEVDWGYRAVPETARVAEAVIEAFYGQSAEPSIFQGCSTGGRMANMLAVRDPDLFDGIINGAPALDYTGLVATFMASVVQANTDEAGDDIITPEVVPVIQEAVYDACDAVDGLEDGLISDPGACTVDFSALQCAAAGTGDCLTDAQIDTLTNWYQVGARSSDGTQLYPAVIPYGSEPYWWLWLTGNDTGAGRLVPVFNEQFLRFMAFEEDPGDGYSAQDFDFDADPPRLATMAGIYNSDNPDLGAFRDAGGVMLMWHGWADAIVPPGKTIDYYQQVVQQIGGQAATDAFLRLFMIPGMDHCGLLPGPGIDQAGFDPLTAMEEWLATDAAPSSLLLTRRDENGTVDWTRPACRYPLTATYVGEGDWRDAANFVCEGM